MNKLFCPPSAGLGLLIGLLVCSCLARAEEFSFKREAFAKFGYGRTSEDEGSLGSGPVFSGGLGFQLTPHWQLAAELHFQQNTLSRGAGQFFSEGDCLSFGASALYHFSGSRARPYLRIGLYFARFEGAKGFAPEDPGGPGGIPDPGWRREGKQNFLGPEFGAGIKIFVTKNVSVQPELRLFAGGSSGYDPSRDVIEPGLFLTSVSMGAGYHW
jgi:opacity protein-like surface antigen